MKLKKTLSLVLATAMMTTMFAACGGGNSNTPNTSTPAPGGNSLVNTPIDNSGTPDANQYLNLVLSAEPSTLDTCVASDQYSGYITVDAFEPLVRLEEDENGKNIVKGAGAEKWESNAEGTVWTFHLRDNKWSDGKPVTAENYAYGIRRSLDPKTGSPSAYLIYPIKNSEAVNLGKAEMSELGVKVIDEKTLEITLESPTPYFIHLVYQRVMFPQRQDIVEQHGDKYGSESQYVVGNGPFIVDSWVHNNKIVMKKNPHYWDAATVKLDTITWNIIQETTAIYNSLDNNSVDMATVTQSEWIQKFGANDKIGRVSYPRTTTNYAFFNHNDEVFKNANIRKAFMIALNREEITEVIWSGINAPAYSWVPKGISVGNTDYRGAVEEPILKIKSENPDPKALLIKGMQELGLGEDPSKLKVSLSLAGTDQWFRTFGEYMQQSYKKNLGVTLEISFNEWPIFEGNVQKGNFQMGYMGWGAQYNDPMSMLNLLRSGSTSVRTGWSNAKYDDLLKKASIEMDDAKRLELYRQAENILLYEDGVVCPVIFPVYNGFHYNYVKNSARTPLSTTGNKYVYTSGRK